MEIYKWNFRSYICKREFCEKLKFRESSSAAMNIQQNNERKSIIMSDGVTDIYQVLPVILELVHTCYELCNGLILLSRKQL